MTEDIYYDAISRNTDWGGDESTQWKPVAGSVVQTFIKSELNSKIGIIYKDEGTSMYLGFANQDTLDEYLQDPSKTELILASFQAPSSYIAEIDLKTNHYNAILLGTKGNRLEFGFNIKNTAEQVQIDDITYVITFTRNANKYELSGSCRYEEIASINIDEYLSLEGTTTITISIQGVITKATASTILTYDVVSLDLSSSHNVSTVYDTLAGDPLIINYSIFGSNTIKYIEWYLDGNLYEIEQITGGTIEPLPKTKYISLENYISGVHNLQFRAFVELNGDKFYTNTLYKDFIVIGENSKDINIALELEIPNSEGIVTEPCLYNVYQYEAFNFTFGVYNKANLESIPVYIYIDDVLKQVVYAKNNEELTYSFISTTSGTKVIKLIAEEEEIIINAIVHPTNMQISEITDGLELSLSAVGRSNSDANLEDWSYGKYTTLFNGFNWNETSGWNDNRLIIGEGMSITTNITPLYDNTYGKTLEFEFETINVVDDSAVLCDLRDTNGLGLLLTASEASLKVGLDDKQIVSTKFKSNENIRISFVINSNTKLVFIYINGIVSGAIKYTSSFNVYKALTFTGSSDANIKIKQILIYNGILTSDQILNNYILYRDTVDEMISIYDKNDIIENSLFSVEKISRQLPVMLITGDIAWMETQTTTSSQTPADIEYINVGDPTKNFKMKNACLRIQGTSSANYPKKNYRVYTNRKGFDTTLYDYNGNIIEDKTYSFKDGAIPVDCWCLKADYAESSGTHNTGVATIWNNVMYNVYDTTEGYVCRTEAQKAALQNDYPYDVRTTVDGFPIVVFARQTENDEYLFIGKYNFNNDKSTENVFGFCDIPGFDNSKMQCWELVENGNKYALFNSTEDWYEQAVDKDGNLQFDDGDPVWNWATGFEARYPDDGYDADTTDLKNFADWLLSCDSTKFYNEKKNHIDIWKVAAYYVYLLRFGAVDQVVKNSMFTSEDGQHWYFINYDNDTILGVKNTGALVYPPTITRDTMDGTAYVYAGRDSRLWNFLENDTEFMQYVSKVDSLLYDAGLTYEEAIKYFNINQSNKWCERIYNQDADYKYISLATTSETSEVDTLFMMQGSREAHRTWWLAKRFKLMDGKFGNDVYNNQFVEAKLNGSPGLQIGITAGEYMYYGCGSNEVTIQKGVELNQGDTHLFEYPADKVFAVGDPIKIFAPYAIEELDLSGISKYLESLILSVKDPILGTRLKKLILAPKEGTSQQVQSITGLPNATSLEYLDIQGLQIGTLNFSNLKLLKTLLLKNSGLVELELPNGCSIETLQLGESLKKITFNNLPNLTLENIEGYDTIRIPNINIHNCSKLTDNFNYYYQWIQGAQQEDNLNLSGIYWTDVSPEYLIQFKKLIEVGGKLSLKGKIEITDPTTEHVNELKSIFGENCFTNNAELWISAPESLFIHGVDEMRSGDSYTFTTTVFSDNPGSIEWQIVSGEEWVESIISNSDNTGTLTTKEDTESDHEIVIRAIHKPKNDDTYYKIADWTVISKKVIYATSGTILGNATLKKQEVFTLSLLPDTYNGDYSTIWTINGNSFDNGSIVISSQSASSCTIDYLHTTIFDLCTLVAQVTNKNGTQFSVELIITVTDETVLLTSTSNPEVMKICYDQGWSAKTNTSYPDAIIDPENVMYKWQAWYVEDIADAFTGNKDVVTFNEFQEFKNVKSIPANAFFQCSNLQSIVLPSESLYSIGSYAFGSTGLKELFIPTLVSNINSTAFIGSPIQNIFVSNANITYKSIDGVLCNTNNVLLNYPEGKTDIIYTTPDSIIGLETRAIYKNPYLQTLNISDSVISHKQYAIAENSNLTELNIGANFSAQDFSKNVYSNNMLQNINVNSEHNAICSVDGVVYDLSKTTLWKYPEGRSYLTFESSVTKIGAYSIQSCNKVSGEIIFPDQVEIIDMNGLYACQYITSIVFNSTSKLHTLGVRALQLSSRLEKLVLPPSLLYLDDSALSYNGVLKEIHFLGQVAPTFLDVIEVNGSRTITTVFGASSSTWTGNNVTGNKIVYTLSNAVGFDHEDWTNSIFSSERNNFILSQTL